jgi:hypothetical protein
VKAGDWVWMRQVISGRRGDDLPELISLRFFRVGRPPQEQRWRLLWLSSLDCRYTRLLAGNGYTRLRPPGVACYTFTGDSDDVWRTDWCQATVS